MNETLMLYDLCEYLQNYLGNYGRKQLTACYLVNDISRKPSDYFGLGIFGCPAYDHVNDIKLEPRVMKCIFLGYVILLKGYQMWCAEKGRNSKFIMNKDVTFA